MSMVLANVSVAVVFIWSNYSITGSVFIRQCQTYMKKQCCRFTIHIVVHPLVCIYVWEEASLQICLLTAMHWGLNGQSTIGVVKGAEHTKTHWEYIAPADQWPHPESVSLSKAARPKSSGAFSALQITNQHQTPNKETSTSFKSN